MFLIRPQNEVIDSVLRFLAKPNSLAQEPVLDLLAQLARDLRGDLYRRFKEIFFVRNLVECIRVVTHPGSCECRQQPQCRRYKRCSRANISCSDILL